MTLLNKNVKGTNSDVKCEASSKRFDVLDQPFGFATWLRSPWKRQRLASAITAVAVITVFFFFLFPGAYTFDSIIMYTQADNSTVDTNWHPPLTIAIWGVLLLVVKSAVGLWVTQTLGLGIALYTATRSVYSKLSMMLIGVLVLVTPPFLQVVAPLWKDSQLAIVYLAALGLSRHSASSWRKRVALGLVAFAIVALRFNAFPLAALPLWRMVEGLPTSAVRFRLVRWVGARPVRLALGLTLGLTAMASYTGSLFVERSLAPQNPTQVWDMVGILVEGGDVEFSAEMQRQPPCSTDEILTAYDPGSVGGLTYGEDTCFAIVWPDDYENQSLISEENSIVSTSEWVGAIIDNPGPYARHRIASTRSLLGIEHQPTRGSSIGLSAVRSPLSSVDARVQQVRTLEYMRSASLSASFVYRPFVWILVIGVASLVLLGKGVDRQWLLMVLVPFATTLGISIILSPVATLRYSFPSLVAAIFLVVQAWDHVLKRG